MSHGHDDHGPAAPASLEMPAEPAVRTISPAGADLPFPLPGAGILWPLVWLGVACFFWWGADRTKGEILTPHAHSGEHAPAAHGEK